MAGAIFLTKSNTIWTVSSNAFIELLERTISRCSTDEQPLAQVLNRALDVRCLDIAQTEPDLQSRLVALLLNASRETLQVVRLDPKASPDYIERLEQLVRLEETHLNELRGGQA